MRARKLLNAVAVSLAVFLLPACGGGEEEQAGEASMTAATAEVEIADFEYVPETITVAAGDEVTWTNADDAPHTATAEEGSFDTGDLDRAEEGRVTFDAPGTYSYYCRFHAFMKGTVEVR